MEGRRPFDRNRTPYAAIEAQQVLFSQPCEALGSASVAVPVPGRLLAGSVRKKGIWGDLIGLEISSL